ncbi:7655_t:CDS:2 [Entrophospora sp. SA101]|nr:7655_t:CDS:2 [Entrophospora sp. SA101]
MLFFSCRYSTFLGPYEFPWLLNEKHPSPYATTVLDDPLVILVTISLTDEIGRAVEMFQDIVVGFVTRIETLTAFALYLFCVIDNGNDNESEPTYMSVKRTGSYPNSYGRHK